MSQLKESAQDAVALLKCTPEPLLLQADYPQNEVMVLQQFPVNVAEMAQDYLGHLGQERLRQAQLASVADGPADDPAQDIAPPLVTGDHAVADQKGGGPCVFGHHPQGVVGLLIMPIGLAG